MTAGSTPAKPKPTMRIPTFRPSSAAVSSPARIAAVAPSLSPAALPAVTRPAGRNGVFSAARFSRVVPGRGGSSSVARPHPAADLVATGTSVSPMSPARLAASYFSWLATA